jgi:hypothetical protein
MSREILEGDNRVVIYCLQAAKLGDKMYILNGDDAFRFQRIPGHVSLDMTRR